MRIAISGYFLLNPATGTGQYTAALIRSLGQLSPDEIYLVCPRRTARLARSLLEGREAPWRVVPLSIPAGGDPGKLWFEQVALPRAAGSVRADLLHVPYLGPPLVRPCKTVVTIHDLIMLLFPETRRSLQARAYTRLVTAAVKGADFVLADSASTRDDIVRSLGIPGPKVRVTHLACGGAMAPVADRGRLDGVRKKYGLEPEYIFYIGGLDWRKNLQRLLRAFASLPEKPQLAIAGQALSKRRDSFPDLAGLAGALGIADRVVFLGHVPEEDKPLLYSGCKAFVFPSLYEGFGLTPLEAMACGAPVVSSSASSLPEVVGDAAVLFDPLDERDISASLSRVLADGQLREDLRRRGIGQAGRFTWRRTAEETLAAYREVLAPGPRSDAGLSRGSDRTAGYDGEPGLPEGHCEPVENWPHLSRIWGNESLSRWNTAVRRARQEVRRRNGRVLEVGCGAGRFMRTLMGNSPDAAYFGCDLDLQSLTAGRSLQDGARYAVADAHVLPYRDGCFSTILVFDVLEHLSGPEESLREINRVTAPGGLLHALVPCEGQPGSLHWLLWRLRLGGDMKERHSGHVQRYTRKSALRLLRQAGFGIERVTYSMHPLGQIRDILSYMQQEPWFRGGRLDNLLFRGLLRLLWAAAYLESNILLRNLAQGSVVMHVTARKDSSP